MPSEGATPSRSATNSLAHGGHRSHLPPHVASGERRDTAPQRDRDLGRLRPGRPARHGNGEAAPGRHRRGSGQALVLARPPDALRVVHSAPGHAGTSNPPLHHVLLPHTPFQYLPSGERYSRPPVDGLVGERWGRNGGGASSRAAAAPPPGGVYRPPPRASARPPARARRLRGIRDSSSWRTTARASGREGPARRDDELCRGHRVVPFSSRRRTRARHVWSIGTCAPSMCCRPSPTCWTSGWRGATRAARHSGRPGRSRPSPSAMWTSCACRTAGCSATERPQSSGRRARSGRRVRRPLLRARRGRVTHRLADTAGPSYGASGSKWTSRTPTRGPGSPAAQRPGGARRRPPCGLGRRQDAGTTTAYAAGNDVVFALMLSPAGPADGDVRVHRIRDRPLRLEELRTT